MKYLSHYTEEAQTNIFDNTGAFFAFGKEQFTNKKVEGVNYVQLGSGLVCPKDKAEELTKGLENIQAEGIKKDIEDNGIKAIIHRELGNYETHLTLDFTDTTNALKDYGITKEQIKAEYADYYQKCIDNDWF